MKSDQRRRLIEQLEVRRLLSASVALVGSSGADNFVISFDPSSLMYSFSGGSTSPGSVAASDLTSVSIAGGGGADTLTINGGSPTVLNDLGSDGSQFAVEVTAGTLNFFSTQHLSALTIDAGGGATLLGNGSHVLETGALSIAGSTDNWTGQLDLTNNNLIVHNGSLPTLTNQIKSGYAVVSGTPWSGEGITSSAAGADTSFLTALGVIQNSSNGLPTGTTLYGSFASQTAVNTDVLVRYTFYGDANLSGHVDGSDYSLIDNGYNAHMTGWINGDFNYDGTADGSDYTLIDNAFNNQGASAVPTPTGPAEPTGVTIVQALNGEIDIQWNPSPDSDVVGYDVYTGNDPNFIVNPNNLLLAGVSNNAYSDYFLTDPTVTWYYRITAVYSSGAHSIPSTATGTMMPASTSPDYTDAPDSSIPPDSSYDVDADGNTPDATAAAGIAGGDLVGFYGAGSSKAFGNIHLAAIVSSLGGTLNSTKDGNNLGVPYTDFQMIAALGDLLKDLDTNGDKVISAAEIAAKVPITVIGYSWGAIEATNFTRLIAASSPHLLGTRMPGLKGPNAGPATTGGYNLTAAITVKSLVTIDPVLHAVIGLSGLIKSTDGPLANVVNFTNYYESRGGTTHVEQFSAPMGGVDLGPDPDFQLGNAFSSGIHGDMLKSHAQNPATQTNITTQEPNLTIYTSYKNDGGAVIYGQLKGSMVQHDGIPFFVQQTVIDLLNNS